MLKARGLSIAALAREVGVSRCSVARVMNQPSARLERAVADALGVKPNAIFPERYDRRGQRLLRTREIYADRNHGSDEA